MRRSGATTLAAAIVLFALMAARQSLAQEDAREVVRSATVLFEAKDYTGAKRALKGLLDASPDDPDALLLQAKCEEQLGNIVAALASYNQVIEVARQNPGRVSNDTRREAKLGVQRLDEGEWITPPPADEQNRLIAIIDEAYDVADARDQDAKVAMARKLLEAGRQRSSDPTEQFVLYRRASEIAVDGAEADLMLQAVDAIAEAGFNVQPLRMKARLLNRLLENPGVDSQRVAVITACVQFAEAAAAGGAADEACTVMDQTRKALARWKTDVQQARRAAKAAWARERNPSDRTALQTKVNEAEAELQLLQSAHYTTLECIEGLQQARRERDAAQLAQERLRTEPDDPDACLALGRWYCFYQADWEAGLKLLAKGSDDALKSLAAEELASKPSKAEDQTARGDKWWGLAGKTAGIPRGAMRRRATSCYLKALPDLAPGSLAKQLVEKRLAEIIDEPEPDLGGPPGNASLPLAKAPFGEKSAKTYQIRWAKYLGTPVVQTNTVGMKFALIPPGEFVMGSPQGEEGRDGDETQHQVRLTNGFYVGMTEVTQGQWQAVMGNNPSSFKGDANLPVENVSWDDVVEFCRKLSQREGKVYRLPSEAEWEYACRAGTTGTYAGTGRLDDMGWYDGNSGSKTHVVGGKQANAWGLYDVHGNVWEWCLDWKSDYPTGPMTDPTGPSSGSSRVLRGGSWDFNPWSCRSAYRDTSGPGDRNAFGGFRVVSSAVPGLD